MNPAIQTNGQVAVSILRESALLVRSVIDNVGLPTREPIPANIHSPHGMRSVLRIAGKLHGALYTRTAGRLGGTLRGGPVLLLTTTGRKTGQERTRPLSYLRIGDEVVLVASAAGASRHPAWYLNLRSNPRVRIQQGGVTRTMVARSAEGDDRSQLWEWVVRQYPVAAGYQRRTGREIPVVILRPIRAAEPRTATNPRRQGTGISLVPAHMHAAA